MEKCGSDNAMEQVKFGPECHDSSGAVCQKPFHSYRERHAESGWGTRTVASGKPGV